MSWRIVVVNTRAKLDLQMNYLVIRKEEITKIFLGEIGIIIIENTAVSLTAALLAELVKRKIKVIFCDEKRNPSSELLPYYGSHDCSLKIRNQIKWDKEVCDLVWTLIVEDKIKKQRDLLKVKNYSEHELLDRYLDELELFDTSNREGHAAKVYFNALFGLDFSRSGDNSINAALNYGYAIILSAFNREIVANGYLTQIGIFHNNIFNPFNLSSDLMEPYRPLIDSCVYNLKLTSFENKTKLQLIQVLTEKVKIMGKTHSVDNAIKIYVKSVFDAIEYEDANLLRFYEIYEK